VPKKESSVYYTVDLIRPELTCLQEIVRAEITRNTCPKRAEFLDYLYNNLNGIDKRVR
jgi:hypothetical protein